MNFDFNYSSIDYDYYPFGMVMPGRNFNSSTYDFGFQGQMKDDEVYGNGNLYTAEYWQYDPRLARRWNVDPIMLAWHSTYSTFNNNPIIFRDPLGLYGTPEKAERKREKAEKNGWKTEAIYVSGSEWGFYKYKLRDPNATGTGHVFGKNKSTSEKVRTWIIAFNPIKDAELYVSGVIKTNIDISLNSKLVIPFGGVQYAASVNKGDNWSIITGTSSYININVGNLDTRVYPYQTGGQNQAEPQGDWDTQVRTLYTIYRSPIIISADGVPIPVGEIKFQGDAQGSFNEGITVGGRCSFETIRVGPFSAEASTGVRFELKVPNVIRRKFGL